VRECVGSLTSTRDKANSQYISEYNSQFTNGFYKFELGLKFTFNTSNTK